MECWESKTELFQFEINIRSVVCDRLLNTLGFRRISKNKTKVKYPLFLREENLRIFLMLRLRSTCNTIHVTVPISNNQSSFKANLLAKEGSCAETNGWGNLGQASTNNGYCYLRRNRYGWSHQTNCYVKRR